MMLTARSKTVIAVNSVFPVVAVLAVAIRMYARRLKFSHLDSSDYTILVALVWRLPPRAGYY